MKKHKSRAITRLSRKMRKYIMKKVAFILAVLFALSALFAFSACQKEHVHEWGEWQLTPEGHEHYRVCKTCGEEQHSGNSWGAWERTETEHYRVCTICGEEERGEHKDGVCDTCAEFKVLSIGFDEGGDPAHSHFAREANVWFKELGAECGFVYDY